MQLTVFNTKLDAIARQPLGAYFVCVSRDNRKKQTAYH